MPTIGISGSYGGLNLGDEAILASACAELRRAVPGVEIVAFSRDACHTRRHQDVDRAIGARTAFRDQIVPEVERLDVLLLGGGGILYDSEAQTYLREVEIAQELGVPTCAYAIGIGPLRDREERAAVRDGLNRMRLITVREATAKRLCEEIGVAVPVRVTADPALLLEPEPFDDAMLRDEGIPTDRPLVGLSVREAGPAAPDLGRVPYHDLIAQAADYAIHRFDADAVFVPMEQADRREIHRTIALMACPQRAHVLKREYGPRQALGLVGRFEMALGMRLHFLIFAALRGVPLMPLPYASKVMDFLSSLGLSPKPLEHEHPGAFLADLDRLWDAREEQALLVAERLPRLRELSRRTVPLALSSAGLAAPAPLHDLTGEDVAGTPYAF